MMNLLLFLVTASVTFDSNVRYSYFSEREISKIDPSPSEVVDSGLKLESRAKLDEVSVNTLKIYIKFDKFSKMEILRS